MTTINFEPSNLTKNVYQYHSIVRDSNYDTMWYGKVIKDELIDYRKGNHLIALENWSFK